MKKGHILLSVAAIVIFVICYYYSLGLLTVVQAIFSVFIFTFFAALLIEALSGLIGALGSKKPRGRLKIPN